MDWHSICAQQILCYCEIFIYLDDKGATAELVMSMLFGFGFNAETTEPKERFFFLRVM